LNYNSKSNDRAAPVQREETPGKGISFPAVPILKQHPQSEKESESFKSADLNVLQAKPVNQGSTIKPFQSNNPVQKKNTTGLPDDLKVGVEKLSGFSMDDVKVHYNSDKPAQLQAFAYAQGADIHVGQGQERHLPHEAWHVVQQKQGRVRPTLQMKNGATLNDDIALESEADAMGAKASAKVEPKTDAFIDTLSGTLTKGLQSTLNNNAPLQLTQDDASKYVYSHKDDFYKIDGIKNGLFKGCKHLVNSKLVWWEKWGTEDSEEDVDEDDNVIYLTQYVDEKVDKKWVEEWVANKSLPSKLRLGLFYAWNNNQEEESVEEDEFAENVEEAESNILSQDLIADLVKDVSKLNVNKENKLTRSDSFTFGTNKGTGVFKPDDILKKMTDKVTIEIGTKGVQEEYPVTNSIQLAGLYIRAYGDDANSKERVASTKFVFNLGGSLGLYRDTTGNGDLFYFPLVKNEGEEVYKQEGGSTEHTWDKLAKHLSTVEGLENVHVRLAEALSSEYTGTLSKSEVIAIGAMLADAKYSIQGWLYAVEGLKKYKFDGKTISNLFDVIGDPFWKYSLNASNDKNKGKNSSGMGRQAGVGYKDIYLTQQEKVVEEKDNKRKRRDSIDEEKKDSTNEEKKDPANEEKKEFKKIKLIKNQEQTVTDQEENTRDIQDEDSENIEDNETEIKEENLNQY